MAWYIDESKVPNDVVQAMGLVDSRGIDQSTPVAEGEDVVQESKCIGVHA